jgi:hypothetical protein
MKMVHSQRCLQTQSSFDLLIVRGVVYTSTAMNGDTYVHVNKELSSYEKADRERWFSMDGYG